jgi:hypothetical protein
MTRDQLEHAIRAACEVSGDTDLFIFGSQAVLGTCPDAPPELRSSIEVDVQPVNRPEAVDDIDGTLGEFSMFHSTHGFYVHGLLIEEAYLPTGWKDRTVAVSDPDRTHGHTGHCLELHDLAVAKLCAFREKDRQFVRVLLVEKLVDPSVLGLRIVLLSAADDCKQRLKKWVDVTREELD